MVHETRAWGEISIRFMEMEGCQYGEKRGAQETENFGVQFVHFEGINGSVFHNNGAHMW